MTTAEPTETAETTHRITLKINGKAYKQDVQPRKMLAYAIRKGEKLIQCENCTRILYPVKPPAPAQAAT